MFGLPVDMLLLIDEPSLHNAAIDRAEKGGLYEDNEALEILLFPLLQCTSEIQSMTYLYSFW